MSCLAIPVQHLLSLIHWESKRKPRDSIYLWGEFIGNENEKVQLRSSSDICGGEPLKPCYDEGNSFGKYHVNDLVIRLLRHTPKCHKVLRGEAAERSWMQEAIAGVRMSIVCLSLLKDDEASAVFSVTVVRSDGIVATSADCLKHLKGTKHKIGVKILGDSDTYKGVLLHTDFPSKIAFVKILCRKELRLRVPKWGKLGSRRKGDQVVGAGCNWDGNWKDSVFGYSLGVFSSIDDKEKTESHNACLAWASGQLIKASCGIGKPGNGGALVSLNGEVLGVIHDICNWQIEATPIDDVLKFLEYSELGVGGAITSQWRASV